MKLPKIYPITPSYLTTKELVTSEKKLKEDRLNLFLYRRKTLPKSQIRTELALMAKVCLEEQIYLILNSHHLGESVNKFSGIHLTSVDSRKENSRYITGDNLLRISCHSEEDIMKAESLKADYIFLSPIKETNSHKELEGIGWDRFYQLSKKTSLPAYALGGIKREDLKVAESYGVYGIVGIRNFWST